MTQPDRGALDSLKIDRKAPAFASLVSVGPDFSACSSCWRGRVLLVVAPASRAEA